MENMNEEVKSQNEEGCALCGDGDLYPGSKYCHSCEDGLENELFD